jgi:hypothetical protein
LFDWRDQLLVRENERPELGNLGVRQSRVSVRNHLVVLGLVTAALTGCAGPSPVAPAELTNHSQAATGTLQGHLYGVGGPAPGTAKPWPGTVTISGTGYHRDISVGAHGAYSVVVPAGRYVVVGHSAHLTVNDVEAACPAPQDAQVAAGHTATLDAFCHMR